MYGLKVDVLHSDTEFQYRSPNEMLTDALSVLFGSEFEIFIPTFQIWKFFVRLTAIYFAKHVD